jgi:hypothetical protein
MGKPCSQLIVEQIVSHLNMLGGTVNASGKADDFVIMPILEAAMQLLSAEKFLGIVSTLLDNDSDEVILIPNGGQQR